MHKLSQNLYTSDIHHHIQRGLISFIIGFLIVLPCISWAQNDDTWIAYDLWFVPDSLTEGEQVRIYAAFQNNTPHDVTGIISFTNNDEYIGNVSVRALAGKLAEGWIDWTPSDGEYTLEATLSDVVLHIIGSSATEDSTIVTSIQEKVYITPKVDIVIETEEDTDEYQVQESPPTEAQITPGIERFLDDGIAHTMLSTITKKIEETKRAVDEYRTERSNQRENDEPLVESSSQDSPMAVATITRSSLENKSFLNSLSSGAGFVLEMFYSLLLFITSRALAHPALIQIFLLLSLLFIIYRTAWRLGRRRF